MFPRKNVLGIMIWQLHHRLTFPKRLSSVSEELSPRNVFNFFIKNIIILCAKTFEFQIFKKPPIFFQNSKKRHFYFQISNNIISNNSTLKQHNFTNFSLLSHLQEFIVKFFTNFASITQYIKIKTWLNTKNLLDWIQ